MVNAVGYPGDVREGKWGGDCQMEPKPSTDDQLWRALRPLLARLQALAQTDAVVRAELLQLGNTLLTLATTAPTTTVPITAPAVSKPLTAQAAPPPMVAIAIPEQEPQPLATTAKIAQLAVQAADQATEKQLIENAATEHQATETVPLLAATPPSGTTTTRKQGTANAYLRPVQITPAGATTEGVKVAPRFDLESMATSCALKADAARWMGECQRLLALGKTVPAEVAAQKWKLIEHAQTLPECYLWMLHQELPATTDPTRYADLGNCYEACALMAALLEKLVAHERQAQPFLIQALSLAAIVQAALRNAIQALEDTVDTDQRKLFQWVEAAHAQHHLQMRRYTKRSKEANPRQSAALIQQVQELFNKISTQRKRQNAQRRLWRQARSLAENLQADLQAVTVAHWQALVEAVEALVDAGIPASSVELRKLLLPLLDQLVEPLLESSAQRPTFTLVLREVERFLDQEPAATAATPEVASSGEVLQVRTLLQGQRIVFIGGERRLAAEEALRNAFALKELIWLEGHDQTYTAFEPYVARPDVNVVILALRWSRHGFGQVKEYCDHYDKLFVRLVGGYNPNQVAHVLLKQIGDRLAQRGAAST